MENRGSRTVAINRITNRFDIPWIELGQSYDLETFTDRLESEISIMERDLLRVMDNIVSIPYYEMEYIYIYVG